LPRDAVLLVDEAGQIGGKQMYALLLLAEDNHARVILSGDTRQHGAVEASDALRAIEKYSGLEPMSRCDQTFTLGKQSFTRCDQTFTPGNPWTFQPTRRGSAA